MNSTTFPSSTQSLFTSTTEPPISPLQSPSSLKFHNTHVKISPISTRKTKTTTAAAVNRSCTPSAAEETLYDLLGISQNGTLSDIKKAYKQMALKYHPDVSPPDRAEEYTVKFIQVQEAYETLSDPEARSVYDRCMAKGLHLAFSGTRVDPGSEDKGRWKEAWKGQISELMRRSRVKPKRSDPVEGMSWATRVRMQRSGSCDGVSSQDQ